MTTLQSIVRAYGGLRDDTSLIVVDITPQGLTFPEVHHQVSARTGRGGIPECVVLCPSADWHIWCASRWQGLPWDVICGYEGGGLDTVPLGARLAKHSGR